MATNAVGTVTFDTNVIDSEVKDVNIKMIGGIADTSVFADPDAWKTKKGTYKDWNGTLNYVWQTGSTLAIGAEGTLEATITSGPTFSGTAIITGIDAPMMKDDILVFPVTFEGNGTLTVS